MYISMLGKQETQDDWSRTDVKKSLKNYSFQSMENIVKIINEVFGFGIVHNKVIANGVFIRNKIIHHQGRGCDNETYTMSKAELLLLINEIWNFIKDVNMKFTLLDASMIVKRQLS